MTSVQGATSSQVRIARQTLGKPYLTRCPYRQYAEENHPSNERGSYMDRQNYIGGKTFDILDRPSATETYILRWRVSLRG